MKLLKVTASPLQSQSVIIEDNTSFLMTVYFRPMQQGWYINQLVYGDFVLYGMQIVNSPNLLNQFKNMIPFGLACFSVDNRDPSLQEDFFSGASSLYLLNEEEVAQFSDYLNNG